MSVDALVEWLLDGAPGATSAPAIAERLGNELGASMPIDRLGIFVTTLHPNVLGRAFVWSRGEPLRILSLTQSVRDSVQYAKSPIAHVATTHAAWRWRKGEDDAGFEIIEKLAAEGCVDYVALPIEFINGETHVFTASSSIGFTDEHVAAMKRTVRPLARVTEIYALRRTVENVLNAYVGPHSGMRVLQGHIFKGDVETIRAAIWFSDMRGFTEMSNRKTAKEMIATLNDVFECQVPPIEKRGGEVLKFIGDGLLAIFPITGEASARDRCNAALDAADETFAALAKLGGPRIGLALHVGDVEYGNIGGAARLDFTAIGSAVNLAARIETVTSKLGRPLVVSQEFAETSGRSFEALGSFELKGIARPTPVLAPR